MRRSQDIIDFYLVSLDILGASGGSNQNQDWWTQQRYPPLLYKKGQEEREEISVWTTRTRFGSAQEAGCAFPSHTCPSPLEITQWRQSKLSSINHRVRVVVEHFFCVCVFLPSSSYSSRDRRTYFGNICRSDLSRYRGTEGNRKLS